MSFHKKTTATALLLALPLLRPALAGEPAPDIVLEEVIVTGTLRQQQLDEVAASVTVLDSTTLRDAGQQHFQDVLALVPNLNWAGGTSRPRYFQIRGVGEREQYEGAPNPSVGFLIDDIDFSGLGMPAALFDVGQIEVLRGPQGTRYGSNALAGLIVVRGNDPERDAGWRIEGSAGEYSAWSLGMSATGPVQALDSAWRISLQQASSDGFLHNDFLDRDTNDRDELNARLKWRWFASDLTTLDFTFLHADIGNGYDAWALDNSRTTLSDEPGEDSQRASGGALRLATLMNGNEFTAVATHANSESVNSFDADWGNAEHWAPFTYAYFGAYERDRDTSSLEFRLASPAARAGAAPAWLAGAYAQRLRETGADLLRGDYADPGDPVFSGVDTLAHRYRATNLALFGQLDGFLAPRLRWSGGLRLERRTADYSDQGEIGGEPRSSSLDATDTMLGGQLSLSFDASSSTMLHVALSRGYKAGGFNLGVVADDPEEAEAARYFAPEFLWSVEAGLKNSIAGGRGRADLTVFYQRRQDQQVRTGRQLDPMDPNSYVFVTDNLSKAHGVGLEASLQYAVSRSLALGGSVGLLHTRSGPGSTVDEGMEVPVASREQAHAPGYTAAVNGTWRSARGFMARIDVTAVDAFYFDVPTDHDQKSRAYALVHLKAGYEAERWSIHAWLRNAFDKDYAVRGFFFSNEPPEWNEKLYMQKGDPRQFGLTAAVSF
jgi:outer membrane receptor protein involved in Fe transport